MWSVKIRRRSVLVCVWERPHLSRFWSQNMMHLVIATHSMFVKEAFLAMQRGNNLDHPSGIPTEHCHTRASCCHGDRHKCSSACPFLEMNSEVGSASGEPIGSYRLALIAYAAL